MIQEKQAKEIYEFGPFRLDAGERILLRDGAPVRLAQKGGVSAMLTPKVVETLLALVEREGQIVGKDELMKAVWPDSVVEEGNLTANISLLRKALGTSEEGQSYIETFPKRGYRFNADIRKLSHKTSLPAQSTYETESEDSDLVISKRTRTHVITRVEAETEDDDLALQTVAPRVLAPKITPATSGRNFRLVVFIATVFLLASAAIITGLLLVRRARLVTVKTPEPFTRIKVSSLTTNGAASQAAISPDGQYVVHVTGGVGQQSLQLRNIGTGSDQEILPPGKESFSAVTFSHDGAFVYYIKYMEQEGGVLSQIPVLGGTPRDLAKDVDGCPAFSPDGKQFAFIRGLPVEGEDALIVAGTDGGGERKLLSHKMRGIFADPSINAWGPAWSPDGAVIAFPLRAIDARGNEYKRVIVARVADGTETPLTSEEWFSIGQITWLPDGGGLIIAAAEQEQDAPHQLWHVSYPSGTARRITNDLNNYDGVSLTSDANALVTAQSERRANIWVGPAGEEGRATQLASDKNDGMSGLTWTSDGRVVYTSITNGNTDIWIMDADGKNRKQLTTANGVDHRPSVSFDGRYIVFVSDRNGAGNLWRMDIDGRNPRQLTNLRGDYYPSCAPDNQSVIYSSDASGQRQLWRVPLEGGVPVAVTDYAVNLPVASPDGKFIACAYVDGRETPRRYSTAVVPFAGGRPVKTFEFPRSFAQVIRWTPDNRALTYIVTRAGVSNIWRQSLTGGAPASLTDFQAGTIFRYDWSRDGKMLVLARGTVTSDVVLIKDFK